MTPSEAPGGSSCAKGFMNACRAVIKTKVAPALSVGGLLARRFCERVWTLVAKGASFFEVPGLTEALRKFFRFLCTPFVLKGGPLSSAAAVLAWRLVRQVLAAAS